MALIMFCSLSNASPLPKSVFVALIWVFCCVGTGITATTDSRLEQQQQPHTDDSHLTSRNFPYIYGIQNNPNHSFPVQEYLALSHRPGVVPPHEDEGEFLDDDRPDFLFDENQGYRLVEFYVHWCDICKTFQPHYVQLAQRVVDIAMWNNVTVSVHAVSCAPNRPICQAARVGRYPIFRVYSPGDTVGLDIPGLYVTPVKVLEKMGIEVTTEYNDGDENWGNAVADNRVPSTMLSWIASFGQQIQFWSNPQSPVAGKFLLKRSRDDLRDDIHLSFDYAMRQGVFMSADPLSHERAQILLDWFVLLRKTLPQSWKTLHIVIESLIVNFDYATRSEGYLLHFLSENPPPRQMWSEACSRGDPDAGYSCGLWSLFHVVTVGVVDFNLASLFEDNLLATETVAKTIRDYIDNFFGCEGCRQNFVVAYDLCAHDRCERLSMKAVRDGFDEWIELPLWLLETHNSVNTRLMKEQAARENWMPQHRDEIAVTWPSAADCPLCWIDHDGVEKPNNKVLYKYLKLEYGQRDALSSEYKKEIYAPVARHEPARTADYLNRIKKVSSLVLSKITYRVQENLWSGRQSWKDLEADIHFSFVYAMRYDIFTTDAPLSNEERDLLWTWLHLLRRLLPVSYESTHALIVELIDKFHFVATSGSYVNKLIDEFPSNDSESPLGGCMRRHKTNVLDRYSCGLWELFHTMTVGVVHHNKIIAASNGDCFFTKNVAITIRDYVIHFYDQSRFSYPLDLCSGGSCDFLLSNAGSESKWIDLPIWLFERHNAVNIRIEKEKAARSSRQLTPKDVVHVRWPSHSDCGECWFGEEKWRFNKEKIFKFLTLQYGPNPAMKPILRAELGIPLEVDFATRVNNFVERAWLGKFLCNIFCSESCRRRSLDDLEDDVKLTLDIMLRNNIFPADEILLEDKKILLKKWLVLLIETLPNSWNSIHSLLKEIIDNYAYIVKSKEYLIALVDEFDITKDARWSVVCSNKADHSQRFSCGMWTMLHVASVGLVQHNRKVAQQDALLTAPVASIMRDAMDNFFDCQLCRNIVNRFDSCENDQCDALSMKPGDEKDWIHFPLWLSRLHNSINLEQIQDSAVSELRIVDPDAKEKGMWPLRTECYCCWDDNNQPNNDVTYRYIEYVYTGANKS